MATWLMGGKVEKFKVEEKKGESCMTHANEQQEPSGGEGQGNDQYVQYIPLQSNYFLITMMVLPRNDAGAAAPGYNAIDGPDFTTIRGASSS